MIWALLAWHLSLALSSIFVGRFFPRWASSNSALASTVGLILALSVLHNMSLGIEQSIRFLWIAALNIEFSFSVDELSIWFILLSEVLGLLASYLAFNNKASPIHHASLAWLLFSLVGLFLANDLLLFFFFWEGMLLPIYSVMFLNSPAVDRRSILRFIIITQTSSMILLLSILALVLLHAIDSDVLSFDYKVLCSRPLPKEAQLYLFLGFLLAFLIKLPSFPFHGWLIKIFNGLPAWVLMLWVLVKTSLFGLLKFSWPLFPWAAERLSIPLMYLGGFSFIYTAVLAFTQKDIKRILSFAIVSHAGILLISVFAHTASSQHGLILFLLSNALSMAGLLILFFDADTDADSFQRVCLWQKNPRFCFMFLAMLLASMGFPLFGNFMGEFLILLGIFDRSKLAVILMMAGIFLTVVYCLRFFQLVCFNEQHSKDERKSSADLGGRFSVLLVILMAILFFGITPSTIFWPTDGNVGLSMGALK